MNAMYHEAMAPATPEARSRELLLFRLGGDRHGQHNELFGIDVANVREIVPMPVITAIAGAPAQVLGVVKLRDAIIQVIDLPSLAGCIPLTGLHIMLVTECEGATQAFALEAVEEIVLIDDSRLMAANYGGASALVGRIARLDDGPGSSRLVQVLDIATILKM